jgi:hypothetical protein
MSWLLLLQITAVASAEPLQVRTEGARFLGAAACKSSGCHGGAGEHGQFITWSQRDFHTRAYAILTNARSQRIGAALGISVATESSRCTSCHSPMQAIAPARLTKDVDPREGVSCETCHGAAEPWLRGHTRKDWSYATRVGAGMRDLKSFYVRANTCVACHQNVDSDIAAAGHPELVFELDSQTENEPKHWRDPQGSGVRAWLTGQAVALREVSWRLGATADANRHSQQDALVRVLSKISGVDSTLPRVEATNDHAAVQRAADALARAAATRNFSREFADRTARELAADPALASDFRSAQRLFLALQSLTQENKSAAATVAALRDPLRSASEFDAAEFARRLARVREALSR